LALSRRDHQSGGAAVEFAIVLPLFCAVLFGVVDYGWYFYQRTALHNAVRDGVRFGVTQANTGENTWTKAKERADADLTASNVSKNGILWGPPPGSRITGTMPNQMVTLTCTINFTPLIGFVRVPPSMSSSVTMTLELPCGPTNMERPPLERSGERGAIALLMALALTFIVGFAAFAFDVAYIRLARAEMKTAADAAAHTAMTVLRRSRDIGTARAAAITVAGRNTVLKQSVVLDNSDVTVGMWDYDTSTFSSAMPADTPYNAVQITARKSDPTATAGNIKTTLGRMLGITEAAVAQTSYGAYRPRSLMFEMDTTGSFLQASCAFQAARDADIAFLDAMKGASNPKDRVGMDVFTGDAAPFTPLQLLQQNYSHIRGDWVGDDVSVLSASHEDGIGICSQDGVRHDGTWTCGGGTGDWPNQAFLDGGVRNLHCWDHDPVHFTPPTTIVEVWGGTNIGAAIKRGKETLLSVGHTYEQRAIVIFTDGGPLCCEARGGGALCDGVVNPCCADITRPGGCNDNGTGACACSAAIRQFGWDEADDAAANGIDIYVLAFGNNPPWIDYAGSLTRGRGYLLDTDNPAELRQKLEQFANAIPVALVQ